MYAPYYVQDAHLLHGTELRLTIPQLLDAQNDLVAGSFGHILNIQQQQDLNTKH